MPSTKKSRAAGKRNNERRRSVQSIKVGSALLDVLATSNKPVPLNELSRLAAMSPSKARRYLISFLDCGLVEQNETTGLYDLGPTALRLGLAALSRMDRVHSAVEAAAALSRRIDRTLLVSVWSERGPVIIAWFDSAEIVACNLRVGSVLPLMNSATGNLFLTHLPRKTTMPLIKQWARQLDADGKDRMKLAEQELDRIVEKVRRLGIGTTDENLLPGLSAIAVPVFDINGNIVAAIAEIHKARDTTIELQTLTKMLIDTAEPISVRGAYDWSAEGRKSKPVAAGLQGNR